ncbi:MAG: transposase [Opitutaceae bacterium]
MPESARKTQTLRDGRISIPGAWYFLTACTHQRQPLFSNSAMRILTNRHIREAHLAGDCFGFASCIMPDHWHLLIHLGQRLSLSRLMAKLKANVTRSIRSSGPVWQDNFFEHRIREIESLEAFAFYAFLNPYVSELISVQERWDGWDSANLPRFRFLDAMKADGLPEPGWIARAREMTPPGECD